jgi:sortase (surface protein transpeptidase)
MFNTMKKNILMARNKMTWKKKQEKKKKKKRYRTWRNFTDKISSIIRKY